MNRVNNNGTNTNNNQNTNTNTNIPNNQNGVGYTNPASGQVMYDQYGNPINNSGVNQTTNQPVNSNITTQSTASPSPQMPRPYNAWSLRHSKKR